jgi:hypothetical protein
MNDDFMTLLDKYRQEQQPHGFALERIELPDGDKPLVDTEAFFMEQQQPQQNQQNNQFMQGLLGKSDDLANGLINQSQAQTQEAMQAANMLQQQRNNQMAQTEQQASQALQKQKQEEAQEGALFGKLLMTAITGGFGGLGGGTASAASAGTGFGGAVYPGGWLV